MTRRADGYRQVRPWLSRVFSSQFSVIWIATVILFLISPLLASGSTSKTALLSMLPFAAILAIVACGQTLVIQQGGIDLSVAGMITASAVIVTQHANSHSSLLLSSIVIALAFCAVAGLISGFIIAYLGVTPLVVTLGMNSLLFGVVQFVSHGQNPPPAPIKLSNLIIDKTAGVPNTVLMASAVILIGVAINNISVSGRRFIALGMSPVAAHVAGIAVARYRRMTDMTASVLYGIGGVALAGFLGTPSVTVGNTYLLPSIAAVVLGGTALTGGFGSMLATAIAALFLTQLNQVISAMGASTAVQYIVEGAAIAVGVLLRRVNLPLPLPLPLPTRRRPGLMRPRTAPARDRLEDKGRGLFLDDSNPRS